MIIEPDFVDHWKTRLLVGLLGDDELAPVYLIRLWAHCQQRKSNSFDSLPTAALKAICRFKGNAEEFEKALIESKFVGRDDVGLTVRGWDEYNAALIANWTNGAKGGRPKQQTQTKPTDNPKETHGLSQTGNGVSDREEKSGEEKIEGKVKSDAETAARPVTSVDLSIAMRAAGMQTQPADPRLIALAKQGVSVETVTAACEEAKRAKPGQRLGAGYILAILERWSADAMALKVAGAAAPKGGGNWWASDAASIAKGVEFNLTPRPGERMNIFQDRVRAAIDNAAKPPPAAPPIMVAPDQHHKSIKPEGLDLKSLVGQPKAPA